MRKYVIDSRGGCWRVKLKITINIIKDNNKYDKIIRSWVKIKTEEN